MRIFAYLAGVLTLLALATDAAAQFPGELRGDVLDALSGRPVVSADVRVLASSGAATIATATSDAAGAFRIRALEAGAYMVRVRAPGYASYVTDLRVGNGTITVLRVELVPEITSIEGVVASIDAVPAGARSLSADQIARLPARTAGDVVAVLPGVRIESRGRGAAEVPSVRGSAGDAVLVLVDGVPINDPITGEADLSTLRASDLAAVHVLPGGQSARYGARAEAGVILVETGDRPDGSGRGGMRVGASLGSLGERTADLAYGVPLGGGGLGVSAGARTLHGSFEFDVPESAGGGQGVRENAHVEAADVALRWSAEADGRSLRVGVAGDRLERGLPGRSFAPSRSAEQELVRGRVSASADLAGAAGGALSLAGYLVAHRAEHRDPAPPFGTPFDDRTDLTGAGGEVHGSRPMGSAWRVGGGVAAHRLGVQSSQLSDTLGRVLRTDAGGWVTATRTAPVGVTFTGGLRADRAGRPAGWFLSHDLGAVWTGPAISARVAHRSSFSPPTLGDQFFREGVGISPNPDLAAERVPSEWLFGLGTERVLGRSVLDLDVEAYKGDVRGMILWLPDFRFVWSPRNQDIKRHGVELSARLRDVRSGIDLTGHVSWNRTTYDRPGLEDVQVVYRPEWSGGAAAGWTSGPWRASVTSAFTGARYPVPNRVNQLPAFWATDLAVGRRLPMAGGTLELGLEVLRVLDHEDALIFAFPDPGRTARIAVRWRP